MNYINSDLGKALFERVYETSELKQLGSRERFVKYRQILEDLYKELTKDENQFFSNLFARTEYIFKTYNIPLSAKKGTDSLRRLANQIVHQSDFELTDKDEPFSIKNLCTILSHFSRLPTPEKLRSIYEQHLQNYKEEAKDKPKPVFQENLSFFAVVTDVVPAQAPVKSRILRCENDEMGAFVLRLWNNMDENGFGSDLTQFADLAWPFTRIFVTDVKQYTERENEYYATNTSLIVLEPDYLVEVKTLAECVQHNGTNPAINLLSRFSKGEITESQIIGSLVGTVLDDRSREPDYIYKRTFERFMRGNAFGMLVVANDQGEYNRSKIASIFEGGIEHERNINSHAIALRDKKVYIEPTFISAEFGLIGRLDALYEDKADSRRKDVLELKSGSPPLSGLWKNHEAQTMAYDLLLGSVFPDREGTSSILYSKANDSTPALRFVSGKRFLDRQRLLMLRNQIVANEIKLSQGNMRPLQGISPNGASPVPKFAELPVKEFQNTYSNLTPLERDYFEEFIRFIFKELRIAKMGAEDIQDSSRGFASLWKREKSEKIDDYDVLVYLKIRKISENSIIELLFSGDSLFYSTVTGLRIGDSIVLYPTPDPEVLNPLHTQILKGTLSEISPEGIRVNLINKQVDASHFKSSDYWAVERDFRESSYRDMLLSLYQFMKSSSEKKELILGKLTPRFQDIPYVPNPQLNDNQNAIVQKALNAQDYYLIQGPPGTGKTSTILREIILRLIQKGEQILVLAFTNRAVDEICRMLEKIEKIEFIRIGKGSEPYCWHTMASELHLSALHERLVSARVIVCTQASFTANLDILQVKAFDTLVVDEASQLLEPQVTGFLEKFKRFILVGDENQLPAVVLQDEVSSQSKKATLNSIYLHNLRESLFSRLLINAQQRNWDCFGQLTHHFRMHEDVAKFINETFYRGRLVAALERQKLALDLFDPNSTNVIEQKLATNRVVFIPSKKEMKSKVNDFEADVACQVVELLQNKLNGAFKPNETVGIITPFRAQMATIKKLLGKELKDVSVDTVERYQGSEREFIVLSFAVRNPAQLRTIQSIGPNGVDRKLNVALSRAKEFMIITGCEDVLRKSEHLNALLDDIRSRGGYLELFAEKQVQVNTSVDTSELF